MAVLVGSSRRKRSRPSKSARCRETLIPEDPVGKKLKETPSPDECGTQSEPSDSSLNSSQVLEDDLSQKDPEKIGDETGENVESQPKQKRIIPRIVVDVYPQTPETVELSEPTPIVDSSPGPKGKVLFTSPFKVLNLTGIKGNINMSQLGD